jgi:SAM-dependent methyltransferase
VTAKGKLVRLPGLGVSFQPDGAILVRAPTKGVGARVPWVAVGVLAFCAEPKNEHEVTRTFGPQGGHIFKGLAGAGLLVPQGQAENTPVFFQNFAELDIHRRMLACTARLDAYRAALEEVVTPKSRVLDAGTGTGVLAAMAARAGAAQVFAVDNAEMLSQAAEVMRRSGLHDKVQTMRGDFGVLRLPEPVDVVVTETFGSFALAEGSMEDMASCVEHNLVEGGVVIPKAVQLWLAPATGDRLVNESMTPFDDLDGVDLSPLREAATHRAVTVDVQASDLLGPPAMLHRVEYPKGATTFKSTTRYPGLSGSFVGLVGWFTLELTDTVHLGTGPDDKSTHWHQVYLPIDRVDQSEPADLRVEMQVAPATDDRRSLELTWRWKWGSQKKRCYHRIR